RRGPAALTAQRSALALGAGPVPHRPHLLRPPRRRDGGQDPGGHAEGALARRRRTRLCRHAPGREAARGAGGRSGRGARVPPNVRARLRGPDAAAPAPGRRARRGAARSVRLKALDPARAALARGEHHTQGAGSISRIFRSLKIPRDSQSGAECTLPRSFLTSPRRILPSRRFLCEPRGGRVGLRWRGTTAASATSSCNRASASSRLRSRLRCCCDLMTSTPSRVMRWSREARSRDLTCSGSDEARMSKRRCTAEETLLTFWPPAPCARIALSSISDSGIAIAAGLFTRFFAAAVAIEMAVITFVHYWTNGFSWLNRGYEFTLLWGLVALAILWRGGGPYSLDRRMGVEL